MHCGASSGCSTSIAPTDSLRRRRVRHTSLIRGRCTACRRCRRSPSWTDFPWVIRRLAGRAVVGSTRSTSSARGGGRCHVLATRWRAIKPFDAHGRGRPDRRRDRHRLLRPSARGRTSSSRGSKCWRTSSPTRWHANVPKSSSKMARRVSTRSCDRRWTRSSRSTAISGSSCSTPLPKRCSRATHRWRSACRSIASCLSAFARCIESTSNTSSAPAKRRGAWAGKQPCGRCAVTARSFRSRRRFRARRSPASSC